VKKAMLGEILSAIYPWIKSLHIVSVIAWMAGLFYLPRLFVYHAERVQGGLVEAEPLFVTMERKLLRYIMAPSMYATWLFGLCLVFTPGIVDWGLAWPWVKGISVISMTVFHFWLAARQADFASGGNLLTGRRYRIMNEVPTLLLLLIVFPVVLKF
jgi:putative membrane protein